MQSDKQPAACAPAATGGRLACCMYVFSIAPSALHTWSAYPAAHCWLRITVMTAASSAQASRHVYQRAAHWALEKVLLSCTQRTRAQPANQNNNCNSRSAQRVIACRSPPSAPPHKFPNFYRISSCRAARHGAPPLPPAAAARYAPLQNSHRAIRESALFCLYPAKASATRIAVAAPHPTPVAA